MPLSFQGILLARKTVYRHLRPTPLLSYPLLNAHLAAEAYVKHENHNPTGSFKIRGGVNFMSRLTSAERAKGVLTATRGNHGQSVALACRLYGIRCVIAVPEGNSPEKNQAMQAYGAELLIHGKDFDEAREKVEEIQRKEGLRYIHSANEPDLIHGVGTYALEIFEDLPDPDVIIVPIGGGSGITGVLTAARTIASGVRIIGVQAENAPAVYLSWQRGAMVTTESAETLADGLATRVPFEMTFEVIRKHVDEIVTVSESELEDAVFQLYRTTHNVAEGAGAASTAAAIKLRDELRGKKVVVVLSGSNIDTPLFKRILSRFS